MLREIEISCINSKLREHASEKITHIGGVNRDGSRWNIKIATAIEGINAGKWRFYIREKGVRQYVDIAFSDGQPYLKTKDDELFPESLLTLPECTI